MSKETFPAAPEPGDGYDAWDEWERSMSAKVQERSERELPLPDTLFHATTLQNARQILKEGLHVSRLFDLSKPDAVSLSDDIGYAKRVAAETQNMPEGRIVVLAVDTSKLTPSRVRNYLQAASSNAPSSLEEMRIHEVHYEADIPPDAISILNTKE